MEELGSFLRLERGRLGLTFGDDDLFFRGILILVLIESSPLRKTAVGKLLPSPRHSVPVAALASVVARAAAFEVGLGVAAWFGAE